MAINKTIEVIQKGSPEWGKRFKARERKILAGGVSKISEQSTQDSRPRAKLVISKESPLVGREKPVEAKLKLVASEVKQENSKLGLPEVPVKEPPLEAPNNPPDELPPSSPQDIPPKQPDELPPGEPRETPIEEPKEI